MSKHHAVDDQPHSSEMSWILGLARPADAPESAPPQPAPYYGSLIARAPRHATPDEGDAIQVQTTGDAVASARTGSSGRISAEQIDTLIGRLDAVGVTPAPLAPAAPVEPAAPTDVDGSDEAASAPADEPLPDQAPDVSDTDVSDSSVEAKVTPIVTPPAGRVTPRRGPLRKPVLLGVAAALCLLTLGGATMSSASGSGASGSAASAASTSKTVTIVVDGRAETVTTRADSVSGALTAAGIAAAGHDTLAPDVGAPISDGSTIVLNRGRLLTLTIDGQRRQVWTTARTVDEALTQLGTGTSHWSLSANRSRAIPLTGLAVNGATLHTVAMSVAGSGSQTFTTTARTVGELLAQHQVTLGALDRVSPAVGTRLSDGLVVTVDRVVLSSSATTRTVPQPASKSITDATIDKGTSKVAQRGRAGSELITYQVTSVNGKQTAKTEQSRRTVVQPVATITHVGTKTGFTHVGIEVFTNDTAFGVNWDGLAMCESTHNPRAINADPVAGLPTYGMFQFDLPTWASVGGSGNPIDASPEEQLMRAKLLFQQRGLEPWACRDSAH